MGNFCMLLIIQQKSDFFNGGGKIPPRGVDMI